MKVYLVTGGAGFIGSSVCEELLKLGNKVIIIDNFCDFYSPKIKYRNIEDLENLVKSGQEGRFETFSAVPTVPLGN